MSPLEMPLFRAIETRRSLGLARLKEDPVPPDVLAQLLAAANWAPSHGDTEPWRFQVFTGDARERLGDWFAEAYRQDAEASGNFKPETWAAHRDRALSAPAWISLGLSPARRDNGDLLMTITEERMALACAVQNLHLAATAHGLTGLWHSKGVSVHPHVRDQLGLLPPEELWGFFFLGYPKVPWPDGERGPWQEKVIWQG